MDPDQTAPIGAVGSGSTLFASMIKFVSNVRHLFAADDFSRRHFQMHLFLGALRVKFDLTNKHYLLKKTIPHHQLGSNLPPLGHESTICQLSCKEVYGDSSSSTMCHE